MTQTPQPADDRLTAQSPALNPALEQGITLSIRVRYFETDQMGIVHHANYAVWFEAARSEYCRIHGIDYRASVS